MKFENTQVFNFEGALRGMRNPKDSWEKSDSYYFHNQYMIGENDMKLAKALIKGGSEHRKFLRQIFVSVDITAPIFFFKEFDTYKVGTVANSTSTMHTLAKKPITIDCFEETLTDLGNLKATYPEYAHFTEALIDKLEWLRQKYNETNDKRFWRELICWLPSSWLQKRTITLNYENLLSICKQRKNHKLNEWSGKDNPNFPNFISWARTLPYAKDFIFIDEDN